MGKIEVWNWTKIHELKARVKLSLYEACGLCDDGAQEIFRRVFERIVNNENAMKLEKIYKNDFGAWIAEITINIPTRLNPVEVVEDRISDVVGEARDKTRDAVRLRTLLELAFSQNSETGAREVMEKAGIKVY